jgi:hypothetical protein
VTIEARAVFSTASDSVEVGRAMAERICEGLGGQRPRLALAYLTVNHDQAAVLSGMADVLGASALLLGCSAQGVMGPGVVCEQGYAAGAIGLGGDAVDFAAARVEEIQAGTFEKGRALGRALVSQLPARPKVVVVHYDPLCEADMNLFLAGLDGELGCPVIGGAAGHYHGPMESTSQYLGREVFGHGAVAFAMSGAFTPELAICSGVAPVGIEMTVTRCEGPLVLELDGRRALDVWEEITSAGPPSSDHTAALGLGVPVAGSPESGEYVIRAAFGVDEERGGVVLQAAIPEGTTVMLHHRSVEDVQQGARRMAGALRRRLEGRTVRAVLGFECGARTSLFVGEAALQRETVRLQETIAKDAPWLGLVTWGEIYPVCGVTGFHNYTYPLLALTD